MLVTACHFIHKAEDKLSLPSCVSGADCSRHIFPVHQFKKNVILRFRVRLHLILPCFWLDGQALIRPFLPLLPVAFRLC